MFYSFLRAHEHIYFMECALSQNVLLPLLMVHFVTRMYYCYYYYYYSTGSQCVSFKVSEISSEFLFNLLMSLAVLF